MLDILIKFLAFWGACVIIFMLVLLLSKFYDKFRNWAEKKARERRKILSAKHKIKIPVYCCECKHWIDERRINGIGCPMEGYMTGEYEYCSRGTKEK